jgi:hypothetical protein
MELNVLLWILGGGFTGTWGLCIFFMSRTDNAMNQMRSEIRSDISEIRKEISELHKCVKNHHARLCLVEKELEME